MSTRCSLYKEKEALKYIAIFRSHAHQKRTILTFFPLRLLVLLAVLEDNETGDSVCWKYTLLGRSAVSD